MSKLDSVLSVCHRKYASDDEKVSLLNEENAVTEFVQKRQAANMSSGDIVDEVLHETLNHRDALNQLKCKLLGKFNLFYIVVCF